MKWIKLKSAVGEHKAGDLIQVDAVVAKAYIDGGLAEDGGTGPDGAIDALGLAEFKKTLNGYGEGLAAVFKDAATDLRKSFPRIQNGEAEADKKKSLGDFINNVVKAANVNDLEGMRTAQDRLSKDYGSRPGIEKGMEESTGSAGGFWTVPTQFENTILMEQAEEAVILPGVTNVPMGARSVEWPSLDQYKAPTKGNSAIFGGVTVSRKGENSTRSQTQAAAATVKLEANDLTALTQFSRDLGQDSGGVVESMLTKLIGGALGFRRDWEHMWGTGVGQSRGYIGCPAMLTVNRAVDNIVGWADVAAMLGLLMPSAQKSAVWVAHPYLLTSFLTMTDPSGRYIYIPSFPGVQDGQTSVNPSPMLANLPVLFTEKAGQVGSLGDFTLVNRKAILSGLRGGIEIGLSEHFLFDSDQIALRAKVRDDAQPWLKKPIILGDGAGTNKVSAFIGLKNHAGTA